jgi:uncharacterized protein
MQIPILFL